MGRHLRWNRRTGTGEGRCMKTGEHHNEHGVLVSEHICDTCNKEFTVTPSVENTGWENCMDPDCESYDPKRDADPLFDPDSTKAKIVNLDAHRPHRTLEVICVKCCKRWMAVALVETPLIKYECPNCGAGHVVSTGQWIGDEDSHA